MQSRQSRGFSFVSWAAGAGLGLLGLLGLPLNRDLGLRHGGRWARTREFGE